MALTVIDVSDDVLAQARELARTTNRRMEEVLAEAVMQGLACDRWFREAVAEGQRSADMGPLIPAADVWADFVRKDILRAEDIVEAETLDDQRGEPS
jgi:predicted transcriptional regulator